MKKFNKLSVLFLSVLITASVTAEMNKDHKNTDSKDHTEKTRSISSTKENEEKKEGKENVDQFRMQIDRFGKLPMHY
ncbi:MAG: hypothetical protein CME69_08065 [Halobacteriovorax sp.]|nr:hypothetical protein [Halobacteriovorax sp.]